MKRNSFLSMLFIAPFLGFLPKRERYKYSIIENKRQIDEYDEMFKQKLAEHTKNMLNFDEMMEATHWNLPIFVSKERFDFLAKRYTLKEEIGLRFLEVNKVRVMQHPILKEHEWCRFRGDSEWIPEIFR